MWTYSSSISQVKLSVKNRCFCVLFFVIPDLSSLLNVNSYKRNEHMRKMCILLSQTWCSMLYLVKEKMLKSSTASLLIRPASGRGASVSACADLTNQLQCYWVDPAACTWIKH